MALLFIQNISPFLLANQLVPTKFGRSFYYWTIDIKGQMIEKWMIDITQQWLWYCRALESENG